MIRLIADYKVEGTIPATVNDCMNWMAGKWEFVVDTETRTRGNSPIKMDLHDTEVVMLQIGDNEDQFIIDVRCFSREDLWNLHPSLCANEGPLKIGANIKYDFQVLKQDRGIELDYIWDTMIGEYVLHTGINQQKGFYSLEQTYQRYTGLNPYGEQLNLFREYTPKKTRNNVGSSGPFTLAEIHYGATDIETTYKVYIEQKKRLEAEDLMRVMELENQFVLVLGDMELNGMPIDVDRWLELDEWSLERRNQYLEKLQLAYPEVTNWNSPLQVAKLFKKLGVKTTIKDKKKSRQTGNGVYKDSVQELVIGEQADDFPVIADYLKYKGFGKLNSVYGLKFLKHVSPITERIHSSYIQVLNTGRMSSTAPNMTNIVAAKDNFPEGNWWREAFKSKEGSALIIADYNSQELNIAADKSQDIEMLRALKAGEDLHKLAAAALYNLPLEQVTKEQRRNGKTTNFAIL